MVLVPLFIIPFLALYVGDSLFFPFITGKNFAFRILVEIAFASFAILALVDKRYRPEFSWTALLFKLLVVWMIIADAFAVNSHKAFWSNFERMDGFITLLHVYLFFVVISSILSVDKLWRAWWLTFIGAAALSCLHGIGQLAGIFRIHQSDTRLDANLGNSEYLAGYMLFAIGITLWQALETKGKESAWLRYGLFALTALEVVILYGTQTRGAMVALVGAAFFGTVLWMLEAGKRGKQGAATVLLGLLILVGGFVSVRESAFVQNNETLRRLASISLKELETRFTIWEMAVEGIKERPITGWGQEGFNYIFAKHYQPSMYAQEPWFDRAHDIYLDWLVAGGIPALVLFLLLLLSAVWGLYRADVSRAQRILLLSVLVAYGIQGLVVFDNLFTYIPLAGILAVAHMHRKKPLPLFEKLGELDKSVATTAVVPLMVVALVFCIWTVNVRHMNSGRNLIKGMTPSEDVQTRLGYFKKAIESGSFATQEIREQLIQFTAGVVSSSDTSQALKEEVAAYAVEQVGIEVANVPLDPRMHLQYAVLYRSIGQYEQALKESTLAHELSPRKQAIIFEQGIGAWQAGDITKALEYFQQAYDLEPAYPDAVIYLAAGRVINGDMQGGKDVLLQRFGTTTVMSENSILIIAYYQTKAWKELIELLQARYKERNDVATGFQIVAAYAESGRIGDARAQVREVIRTHPEASAQGASVLKQLGG
jgi:O-antigen ligase/lipoprotein NlpI